MTDQIGKTAVASRGVMRNQNRIALIEATLDSICEDGISGTSVSTIVARANLSRGMIHLHFGGKDKLLEKAAHYASDTYFAGLDAEIARCGNGPNQRIAAVIRNDLSQAVLNERSVRVLYAFRGESRKQEGLRHYSDTRDDKLRDLMFRDFKEIVSKMDLPDPQLVARDATHGTLALLEGMWTDYLLHPQSFNRTSAKRIVFRFIGSLFPSSFTQDGPT